MKSKKITSKEAKYFCEQVTKIIDKYDGVKDDNTKYTWVYDSWTIQTNCGVLKISLHENIGSGIYSIFGRFENVDSAKQQVDCNPYSGKWNIHDLDMASALEILNDRLEQVTKTVEPQIVEIQQVMEKKMDKKLNNLLTFSDFEKSWKPKGQKKTKRTEIGLDIVKEKA